MILSDVSVKRPVFATVVSLLLLAFGTLSFRELPLRAYPDLNAPVVSVSTTYRGASAQVVETKITQIIEDQISGIEGVDSIRSTSSDGVSRISVDFDVNRDIDEAANDVRDKVARVLDRLPEEADPPQIAKSDSDARPIQWFSLRGPNMSGLQLTDYAERYLQDQFATIDGVANVMISGAGRYAMRIWLDRVSLAARNLTVSDIEAALRRENVELPAGRIDSLDREFSVRVKRGYTSAEDFRQLVLNRSPEGHLVRLGEVARVEEGPASLRNEFRGNGIPNVGLGIVKQSTANTLEVLRATNARAERINHTLPEGMELVASSDDSVFIENAIDSVYETLLLTVALVSLVIYMFLGTVRAMIIPAVTIPVCLMAAFILLAVFDYSVNLITLLGLVLAIGLVVDDSIVVLENIQRRVEGGEPALHAAFHGSRQVAFAVIATTAVLIAVFVPIAFLEGNIGIIFSELAVTIGAAVFFSSILALSLTSMMSSKLLRHEAHESLLTRLIDRAFGSLQELYRRGLDLCLRRPAPVLAVLVLVSGGAWWLLERIPADFAPQEDQGVFFTRVQGPEGASFEYMRRQMRQLEATVKPRINEGEIAQSLIFLPGWGSSEAVNSAVVLTQMVPWEQREKSTAQVMGELVEEWKAIPGVQAFPFMASGISRGGAGQQVQFVLGGPSYEELAQWRDLLLERAAANPGLTRVQADYHETKPQVLIDVNRSRAADLGVSTCAIGRTLQTMMSERRVTTYVRDGEEYDVILQAEETQRATPDDLTNIYVRSETTGALIPLSNVTEQRRVADAGDLNHHNKLRAVTISASLNPGYTLGEALDFLDGIVRNELPETAQVDYRGESLEFRESSGGLLFSFGLALLVVFLVLAAQFESFVHPLVIMATVPLATFGALLGLYLSGNTLNIYSNIGIIILVGISTKNGILIVEFTNQLRDQGRAFGEAVREAAAIRLRPVLMTSLATIMGAIPLMLAAGAGAESRRILGIVIFAGVAVATLLTLFVVPVLYQIIARRTGSPGEVAARLSIMEQHLAGGGLAEPAEARSAQVE